MGRLEPYYRDKQTALFLGDCGEVMKHLPSNSLHAVVTDPPYGLADYTATETADILLAWATGKPYVKKGKGFMGKVWDASVPGPEIWREMYRLMRPGAYGAVFAGSRTVDLMGISLRLAGFEIRDGLQWLYGTGMPKAFNVARTIDRSEGGGFSVPGNNSEYSAYTPVGDLAKQWDGWSSALKPAFEPILLIRKPPEGTIVANIRKWGTGAMNIDGCRVGEDGGTQTTVSRAMRNDEEQHVYGRGLGRGIVDSADIGGRWPANVLLDEEAIDMLPVSTRRFFYSVKASKTEREDGLEAFEEKMRTDGRTKDIENPRLRTSKRKNVHPTVKPVELMAWLVRLLTPAGGIVMDPFLGSGSTRMAASAEGARFIGIELSEEYLKIAVSRTAGVVGPLVREKRSDKWSELIDEQSGEVGHVRARPKLAD